jgi:hypothetical protein
VVTLLPHVGKLLAQERNHGIGSVLLLGRLLGAGHYQGREGAVKFGRVDAPSAVGVALRAFLLARIVQRRKAQLPVHTNQRLFTCTIRNASYRAADVGSSTRQA